MFLIYFWELFCCNLIGDQPAVSPLFPAIAGKVPQLHQQGAGQKMTIILVWYFKQKMHLMFFL